MLFDSLTIEWFYFWILSYYREIFIPTIPLGSCQKLQRLGSCHRQKYFDDQEFNKDGFITHDEGAEYNKKYEYNDKDWEQNFDFFDMNHDGKITPEEYHERNAHHGKLYSSKLVIGTLLSNMI